LRITLPEFTQIKKKSVFQYQESFSVSDGKFYSIMALLIWLNLSNYDLKRKYDVLKAEVCTVKEFLKARFPSFNKKGV